MIIIISPPESSRTDRSLVRAMLEGGIDRFHLRWPDADERQIEAFFEVMPKELNNKISVHFRYGQKDRVPPVGAHFSESLRKRGATKSHSGVISASFHSVKDLVTSGSDFDYAFLSPIFESTSKPGYVPTLSLESLAESLLDVPTKVIALGGISSERLEKVKELGFAGAAALGSIWEALDPVLAALTLKETWSKLHA